MELLLIVKADISTDEPSLELMYHGTCEVWCLIVTPWFAYCAHRLPSKLAQEVSVLSCKKPTAVWFRWAPHSLRLIMFCYLSLRDLRHWQLVRPTCM